MIRVFDSKVNYSVSSGVCHEHTATHDHLLVAEMVFSQQACVYQYKRGQANTINSTLCMAHGRAVEF